MSLIMYYPFKNGDLSDIIGGNIATNNGATYTKSLSKDSYYFNGSTSYISAPFNGTVTTELSMFAWVYLNSYTSDRSCILINYAYLTVSANSKVSIYNYSKTPSGYHDSNASLDLNKWYHIGVTWNTTEAKIYINGVLDKTISCTGNPGINSPLSIGNEYGNSRQLNGYISDIRIYNHVLSTTEITQLYTASNPETKNNLIAHYPLNGDTLDYSGYGFNATNSGATIDNNGKIGKCYSFDGSNDYMILNQPFVDGRRFTITLWIYPTRINVSYDMIYSGTDNKELQLFFDSISKKLTTSINNIETQTSFILNTNTINKWYHITWCYDGNKNEVYINGVNILSNIVNTYFNITDTQVRIGSTLQGQYYLGAKINDIRIYNKVLSEKEIKEIARAKILHYNFNDFQEPTVNLAPFTDYSNRAYNKTYSASSWGGDVGTVVYYQNGGYNNLPYKKLTKTVSGTGGSYLPDHYSINIENNKTYTISCYMKSSYPTTLNGYCLDLNRATDDAYRIYSPGFNLTTDWVRCMWIYNSGASDAGIYHTTGIIYNDTDLPIDIYWCEFQVEEKDHATPYTLTSRSGKVNDSSGYNNHSTLSLATTPKYTIGKLGSGGYWWIDSTKLIQTTLNKPTDTVTMNCWFKSNTSGSSGYHIPMNIDSSYYEMSISSSGEIRVGFNLSDTRYVYDYGSGILDGNWHMLTSSYDGTYIKGYIDGVEVGSTNIVGTLSSGVGTFRIGNYDGSSTYGNINAWEDDVRVYATALSLDSIKELYQVGQTIHNNGILETNQFIENGYAHTLINYKGWDVGTFVYKDGWANHWTTEPTQYTSKIILANNPYNKIDKIYENKVIDNTFVMYRTQGLQVTSTLSIDVTKTYRTSAWVYFSDNTSSTNDWYAGYQYNSVCDLNTTTENGNPYHNVIGGTSDCVGKWILCVSYIYPYQSVGNSNNATRYLQDGTIHSHGTDYNWTNNVSSFYLRWLFNYQYGQPGLNQYTLMYRPRFEIIDGTEPTIQELLRCQDHDVYPNTKPLFNANHTININEIREAFTPGITFIKDDSGNSQKLICDYFNGETFAKTESDSFLVNGVTFSTTYQKINPSEYLSKVIMNMNADILYINKIIEN